jgi:hypothetical protein
MNKVAVYITTTPHDYYLAKALIASIQHYCPELPIYLLPDDSYRGSHLFGCPVWRPSDERVLELDGYYKKLRIFWGPEERFIFLDADMLLLKDPSKLLAQIADRKDPFLLVCGESKWAQLWREGDEDEKRSSFEQWVGNIELIHRFDGQYDWRVRVPFSSGFIAASQNVLDRERLLHTFQLARSFHADTKPERRLTVSRKGIFMGDQGFLNYFVVKAGVEVERLDDVFLWGGDKELWQQRASLPGPYAGLLIHWAGCPRPGLLRFGIPGGKEWKRFYLDYCRQHSDYPGLVREVIEERIRTFKQIGSRVKRAWFAGKA